MSPKKKCHFSKPLGGEEGRRGETDHKYGNTYYFLLLKIHIFEQLLKKKHLKGKLAFQEDKIYLRRKVKFKKPYSLDS